MTSGALTAVVTMAAVAVCAAAARVLVGRRCGPFAAGAGPMIAGLTVGPGIVLPAFLLYEPAHANEATGLLLPALAAAGSVLVATWMARAHRILTASRRVTADWASHGTPLERARWGMQAIAVNTGLPIVAVAGIVRPCLFIDRQVLENCSSDELDAIAAHERAHVARHDNLRRLLVAVCSGSSSRRAAAWHTSAELRADGTAAASPVARLALASALLKIARLGDSRSFDRLALSAIHDAAPLEARIRALLEDEHQPSPARESASWLWLWVLLVPLALPLLETVHQAAELAVRHLP